MTSDKLDVTICAFTAAAAAYFAVANAATGDVVSAVGFAIVGLLMVLIQISNLRRLRSK